MNIQTAIRNGLYALLTANTTFKNAVALSTTTGTIYKLFYHIAPQVASDNQTQITPPYVVFDFLPITSSRDTVNKFYNGIITFNISALTSGACENLVQNLYDVLEDSESTLTISGYKVIRIEREPQINLGLIDNVWNITAQYSLQLEN